MTELIEKKPFRWSFSQWECYNQCPAKWKYKYREKMPGRPPGPAAARGLEIHKHVEEYIEGARKEEDLHPDIGRNFIPIFNDYRDHPNGDRWCERKMAFDEEWYLTGPGLKTASCIAVLDAVRNGGVWQGSQKVDHVPTVRIAEWKSGKPKDTHQQQRELYAMFGLRAWLAETVYVTTYYLENTAPPQRLVVKDTAWEKLKDMWNGRVGSMKRDEICAPRPGFHCRFCDYSKTAGGPCAFGN